MDRRNFGKWLILVGFLFAFSALALVGMEKPAYANHNSRDVDGAVLQVYFDDPHHSEYQAYTDFVYRNTAKLYSYPAGCWHQRGDPYSQCTWRPAGKYFAPQGIDAIIHYNNTFMNWYHADDEVWSRYECHEQAHADGWAHFEGDYDVNCAYYPGGAFNTSFFEGHDITDVPPYYPDCGGPYGPACPKKGGV